MINFLTKEFFVKKIDRKRSYSNSVNFNSRLLGFPPSLFEIYSSFTGYKQFRCKPILDRENWEKLGWGYFRPPLWGYFRPLRKGTNFPYFGLVNLKLTFFGTSYGDVILFK